MSLSNYRAPKAVVPFKGGQVEVRGITFDDLAILMRNHLDDVDNLVKIFNRPGLTAESAVPAILQNCIGLVREAPGLTAQLIALAADEPENVAEARSLGMAIQVKVIRAIADLTFEEAGGPKKFLESLFGLMRGMISETLPQTDSPT